MLTKEEINEALQFADTHRYWVKCPKMDAVHNQAQAYVSLVNWANNRGAGKPCDDIDIGYDLCLKELKAFIKALDASNKL